jgi:hypothetical protein
MLNKLFDIFVIAMVVFVVTQFLGQLVGGPG